MQVGRRITVEARRPGLILAVVATLAVLLDQLTKFYVRETMLPSTSIPFVDGVLNITYVRNMGAAFGLMPGKQPLFVATSLLVVVGVIAYWLVKRPKSRWLAISLGLVVGGALGNLIDRTTGAGLVTDFFEFAFLDFPVFNIADMAIVLGVSMLVVWVLLVPEDDDAAAPDQIAASEEPSEEPAPEPAVDPSITPRADE